VRTAYLSQLLIDINAQIDCTILIVTHNINIARTVPDNMGMLFRKHLVMFGPRNYVRRALAGETFRVTRRGRPIVELRAAHHAHDTCNARISLTLARTRASSFFDRVAAGEVIVIERGGEAIAALHPCAG
jgi:antitoxin (DNA-binding transcriptional repressor) of toxin-antitoxin stability system